VSLDLHIMTITHNYILILRCSGRFKRTPFSLAITTAWPRAYLDRQWPIPFRWKIPHHKTVVISDQANLYNQFQERPGFQEMQTVYPSLNLIRPIQNYTNKFNSRVGFAARHKDVRYCTCNVDWRTSMWNCDDDSTIWHTPNWQLFPDGEFPGHVSLPKYATTRAM